MKELRCRDAGFDCEGVVRGDDDQDVMSQATEHLREVHGITEVDEDTGQRLRWLIHEAA